MKSTTWIALVLLATVIGLVVVLAQFIDPAIVLDPRALREVVRDFGIYGPLVFVLIMALARMFFVPGLPLVIAGGIIFGWVGGFALSMIGEMIGATAAFLFARTLGRDMVERWLIRRTEWLRHYDDKIRKHGIAAVIALRLFNILPFTPFDVALGLTRVRRRHFIIGTFIGVLPGTLVASYLGDAIYDLQTTRIVIGAALLAILATLPFVYKRWFRDG